MGTPPNQNYLSPLSFFFAYIQLLILPKASIPPFGRYVLLLFMACFVRLICYLCHRLTKQLTKADFKFFTWGALVTICWSKTIQFRERVVEIPLPCIPGSKLCPVTAIRHAFSFTPFIPSSQAFNWVDNLSSHPTYFYL